MPAARLIHEKFADFMRAERDKYAKLAKDAQIKIES